MPLADDVLALLVERVAGLTAGQNAFAYSLPEAAPDPAVLVVDGLGGEAERALGAVVALHPSALVVVRSAPRQPAAARVLAQAIHDAVLDLPAAVTVNGHTYELIEPQRPPYGPRDTEGHRMEFFVDLSVVEVP